MILENLNFPPKNTSFNFRKIAREELNRIVISSADSWPINYWNKATNAETFPRINTSTKRGSATFFPTRLFSPIPRNFRPVERRSTCLQLYQSGGRRRGGGEKFWQFYATREGDHYAVGYLRAGRPFSFFFGTQKIVEKCWNLARFFRPNRTIFDADVWCGCVAGGSLRQQVGSFCGCGSWPSGSGKCLSARKLNKWPSTNKTPFPEVFVSSTCVKLGVCCYRNWNHLLWNIPLKCRTPFFFSLQVGALVS